jgi:Arc/MetJ-type ribon-helix-helix transcriptional regulator
MKVKTSISLSSDTVRQIDLLVGTTGSRSAVVEVAVRELMASREREELYRRELALLDKHAEALNEEAEDALSYQVGL